MSVRKEYSKQILFILPLQKMQLNLNDMLKDALCSDKILNQYSKYQSITKYNCKTFPGLL